MTCTPLIILLGLLCSTPAGETAEQAFEKGNTLYLAGAFEAAYDTYGDGLAWGEKQGLFLFNQGNCLFKLGRYGEALHCYRVAQRFMPRDAGLKKNIRIVRRRLNLDKDSSPRPMPDGCFWIFTGLEIWTGAACFLSAALFFFALSIVKQCRHARRIARVAAVPAILLLLAGAYGALDMGGRWGVATTPCEILSEPSPSAGRLLDTLREGEEVEVVESREGWHRISAGEDRSGWVREGEVKLNRD